MANALVRISTVCIHVLACWIFAANHAGAQGLEPVGYPQIKRLDRSDPLFAQLSEDIASSRRALARGDLLPPIVFFRYSVHSDEDIYAIAARTNLGVEAIATVNRISRPDMVSQGMELILPNMPGIFAAKSAASDLERMILAVRSSRLEDGLPVVVGSNNSRDFVFFPDEKFHPVERAFFLGILFRFPLREGYISSGFGMRDHPITGQSCLHSGIDIAASGGSDVLAARDGQVIEKGFEADGLGNYLLLSHQGGYTTLYGHLASITVTLNQKVNSGTLIGTVGSTGLSTGPHLHFEVRSGGQLRDPIPLLYGQKE
jgi:murein DD-endopeptidase MepM/ murein hydrolase activator NlpD